MGHRDKMYRPKKPLLTDLNKHLICPLCKGYFVDATTVAECLHTFCRSCIVKNLRGSKYCPVCDVQVHKSKPMLSLRSDRIVQDLVYKLVPKLYQRELSRRREFYRANPSAKPTAFEQSAEQQYGYVLAPDETLDVNLGYHGSSGRPRYLRCPSAVSVAHLQKLIAAKYDLSKDQHVDVLYNQERLDPSLSLIDVMYIHKPPKDEPLQLTYRIYEPKMVDTKDEKPIDNGNNNNWKEVQLRISENGEMSVTGIQDEIVALLDTKPSPKKKELPELKFIGKPTPKIQIVSNCLVTSGQPSKTTVTSTSTTEKVNMISDVTLVNPSTKASTTTVFSTINSIKCSTMETDNKEVNEEEKGTKRKCDSPPADRKKKTNDVEHHRKLLNKSDLTITEVKSTAAKDAEKPAKVENELSITRIESKNEPIGRHQLPTQPCYAPKAYPVLSVPKPKPPSYKTLRDPPKSWNSQISKLSKPNYDGKADAPTKPAKFFKMRNNTPRFLGNPASGVKPMYATHGPSPEKETIRKHSIVKIDPKTLKPISEKAPETSSLSSPTSDLKINTSQVSIFNPLKLQGDASRKSPKSPAKVASPPIKRDKLSFNFTPPNPFVPNLSSQTVSPNQFLCPTVPPGFPAYDPRVMAAYHNLLYGPRIGFPPTPAIPHLGLEFFNQQRKSFAAQNSAGASPTHGSKQPVSPQGPARPPPISYPSRPKKSTKEQRSEKSLQNTLEKLTQNRVKESMKKEEAAKEAPKDPDKTEKPRDDGTKASPNGTEKVEEEKSVSNGVEKSDERTEKADDKPGESEGK